MKAHEFAKLHPFCCFCGGSTKTETIDHQPPKILFPDKKRPKGLEFPACKVCNEQSRYADSLVSLLARFTGGHRPGIVPDKATALAAKSVVKAYPHLGARTIRQQWVWANGILQRRLTLDASDAEVTRAACLVAAKFGLAAYYAHHKRPCPITVKINTMWTHSQHRHAALAIEDLLRKAPRDLALKQGAWNTEASFFLRYHSVDELFVSIAVLHESMVLMSLISRETHTENWVPWSHVWKPFAGRGLVEFDDETQRRTSTLNQDWD